MTTLVPQLHNSSHCQHATEDTIEQRLHVVALSCQQQNLRFTPLRRQVLALILAAKKPIGAYDILAQLQQLQPQQSQHLHHDLASQKALAPPTVYRSLDFLLQHGFIHQLSSANAFIPCCHPQDKHMAVFLICQQCGEVEEVSTRQLDSLLSPLLAQSQFIMETSVMEIAGKCIHCQSLTNQDNKKYNSEKQNNKT